MSKMIKKSLHEILHEPISGSRPKGGVSLEGDIPSLGGENITMSGEISFYPVKKITTEFFESMKRGHLRNLDVLINKDGANTGKSSIYRKSPYPKATINEHLFILRGIEDKLDQEYLHYLIQSSSVKKILETKITGSAQPGLNSTFVQNFPVEITSLPEQKKIASILTSVDDVIEKTQSKIKKFQDLKKSVMNELLTKGIGHTEFKDSELGRIPSGWEIKELKQLVKKFIVPMRDKPKKFGGTIPWIRIEDFDGRFLYGSKNNVKVSHDTINKMNLKIFPINTVLCSCSTVLGICTITKRELISNQTFIGLVADEFKLNVDFLYYTMIFYSSRLQKLSAGTTIDYLSRKNFENFLIIYPKIEEQKKITAILISLDDLIVKKETFLKKYKSLKRSLMQDLLTGKVRVSVN